MPIYQHKLERIPVRLHRPEAYWRSQLRLPSPYRDTCGMLADLCRRLLTRIVTVRWRLTVHFTVEADIDAADPARAAAERKRLRPPLVSCAYIGPATVVASDHPLRRHLRQQRLQAQPLLIRQIGRHDTYSDRNQDPSDAL